MQSEPRPDIALEKTHSSFRIKRNGTVVKLMWVPAHIDTERNRLADKFANVQQIKMC